MAIEESHNEGPAPCELGLNGRTILLRCLVIVGLSRRMPLSAGHLRENQPVPFNTLLQSGHVSPGRK
jgi:hypothetical protein